MSEQNPQDREVTVRRAPKIWPFLIAGALVGVLVAIIVVLLGDPANDYGTDGVMGYFAVIFGIIGVGLAGIVFLIVDRRSLKKARSVTARPVDVRE